VGEERDPYRKQAVRRPQGLFGLPEGTFVLDRIPKEFQNRDDDTVAGAVNLQYHFGDPDVMVYTSFSTGYRPGI